MFQRKHQSLVKIPSDEEEKKRLFYIITHPDTHVTQEIFNRYVRLWNRVNRKAIAKIMEDEVIFIATPSQIELARRRFNDPVPKPEEMTEENSKKIKPTTPEVPASLSAAPAVTNIPQVTKRLPEKDAEESKFDNSLPSTSGVQKILHPQSDTTRVKALEQKAVASPSPQVLKKQQKANRKVIWDTSPVTSKLPKAAANQQKASGKSATPSKIPKAIPKAPVSQQNKNEKVLGGTVPTTSKLQKAITRPAATQQKGSGKAPTTSKLPKAVPKSKPQVLVDQQKTSGKAQTTSTSPKAIAKSIPQAPVKQQKASEKVPCGKAPASKIPTAVAKSKGKTKPQIPVNLKHATPKSKKAIVRSILKALDDRQKANEKAQSDKASKLPKPLKNSREQDIAEKSPATKYQDVKKQAMASVKVLPTVKAPPAKDLATSQFGKLRKPEGLAKTLLAKLAEPRQPVKTANNDLTAKTLDSKNVGISYVVGRPLIEIKKTATNSAETKQPGKAGENVHPAKASHSKDVAISYVVGRPRGLTDSDKSPNKNSVETKPPGKTGENVASPKVSGQPEKKSENEKTPATKPPGKTGENLASPKVSGQPEKKSENEKTPATKPKPSTKEQRQ